MASCIVVVVGDGYLTVHRCCRCDDVAQIRFVVAGVRNLVHMAMWCFSKSFDRCLVLVSFATRR